MPPPTSAPRSRTVTSHWSRRDFLSALGLGAAGALTGCHRRQPSGALQLWLIWPTDPGTPPAHLIERLRLALPGVPLEVNSIWSNNLKEKLRDAARDGALPDVFMLNSAWIDDIGGAASLTDLAPLARHDGLELDRMVVAHDLQRCRRPEGQLCLPAVSSSGTAMLFTNRQLLTQLRLPAPERLQNWDELRALSADYVTRANPDRELEYAALDPFSGPGLPLHLALSFGQGTPTISPDGRHSLLNTAGPLHVAEELDRYVREVYAPFGGYRGLLHFRFRFAGQHRQPSYYSAPYQRQMFSSAAAGTVSVLRGLGLQPGEFAVDPLPGLRGLQGGVRSHWWAYAISPTTPRRETAWKVVRFLSLDQNGGGRFCLDYGRPAHLLAVTDADYRAALGPAWDGVRAAIALDQSYAASPGEEFLRPLLFAVPMRRLQGETLPQIFADLHARFQAYLDHSSLQSA